MVWPNPATDRLTISLNNADPTVQVFNAPRQPMALAQQNIGNTVVLNIASLSAGSYLARTMGAEAKATWFFKE